MPASYHSSLVEGQWFFNNLLTNLNHARALLLRHHGFDVTTCESSEHAREQLKSSPFDVLIFGTTLTHDTCWELAQVFRQSNSDGKIVEIVPSPDPSVKNQPDAVVVSTDEPSKLITTIRENLRKTTRSRDEERWRQLLQPSCRRARP